MPQHRCRALLCCRIELLAPPLSCPVVDASLSGEKENKLLWTVELWRIVLMHYTPILFFFCGECGNAIQYQEAIQGGFPQFHKSTTLSSVPIPSPSAVSREHHGER